MVEPQAAAAPRSSLRNHLIYQLHDRALARAARRHVGGRLLDIGCGVKPYAAMMAPLVREHVGVDRAEGLHGTGGVDLIGTAYSIPVEDGSFDAVLCTSVLEHLEEPEQALRECHRVLRAGGAALYTVPFIWHLHEEPRDFFRFSKYGLQHLFTKAGFRVVEVEAISGFWGTFGQMWVYNMYRYNRGPLRWLRIVDASAWVIQRLALLLERVDRAEQWASLYLVVAVKP